MLFLALIPKSERIRNKLLNLNTNLPHWPEYLYDFARYIANRPSMSGMVTPYDFIYESLVSAYDLARGEDRYTGHLAHKLVGWNPQALTGAIPLIGSRIFTRKHLAEQVERLFLSDAFLSQYTYRNYLNDCGVSINRLDNLGLRSS